MSPWDIVGWLLVVILLYKMAPEAKALWCVVFLWQYNCRRYLRTRNTPPAVGQVWRQDGDTFLRVTDILSNGRICISCGASSWSSTNEEWMATVRLRKLILIRHD